MELVTDGQGAKVVWNGRPGSPIWGQGRLAGRGLLLETFHRLQDEMTVIGNNLITR
jgi:hypothetical protein